MPCVAFPHHILGAQCDTGGGGPPPPWHWSVWGYESRKHPAIMSFYVHIQLMVAGATCGKLDQFPSFAVVQGGARGTLQLVVNAISAVAQPGRYGGPMGSVAAWTAGPHDDRGVAAIENVDSKNWQFSLLFFDDFLGYVGLKKVTCGGRNCSWIQVE